MVPETDFSLFHSLAPTYDGLLRWLSKKNSPAKQETRFDPWVGKIPWRRKWQQTPVFLPGKLHGPRSLEGYSPWALEKVRHDLATQQQWWNPAGHWMKQEAGEMVEGKVTQALNLGSTHPIHAPYSLLTQVRP